ncbi:MAG: PD40 domain-containing protein, partial [Anaerolinea sp.]|nr:PD40 domain-containing protein [Anaerolinea sp.]
SNMSGDNQLYAIDPDGAGLVRLTADWPISRAAAREARSADGRNQARTSRDLETGRVWLGYGPTGGQELTPLTSQGGLAAPAWSPVGDQIAFVSTASGNEEIWLVDRAGGEPVQLTVNSWPADQRPTWSPDGQQIVFASNRTGRRQLWIMNADGSDQRLLFESDYEAWDPIWVKYAE